MTDMLSLAIAGGAALAVATLALVALLSLRALRRGAALEAEMKGPSFAFRLRLLPSARHNDRPDVPSDEELG